MGNGITLHEFADHLRAYRHSPLDWGLPVVIRTAEGDQYVAAVHVDDGQIIIDMGQKL